MNFSFYKEKGRKYIVFILVGLLILVMCIPTSSAVEVKQEETTVSNLSLERQLEQLLFEMEGVGDVKVMISMEEESNSVFEAQGGERVCGVVVVAEGAGSASVNARILEVVKALFSIDAHKISIVKMRSQEERK